MSTPGASRFLGTAPTFTPCPRAAFCTCTRCSGLCCPTRDPVCTPRCLRLAYTPHVIDIWLGSAHLRRETAPPCGSCGRCLGGYPWAARAGGVLRVGCAASPTAVLAADGDGDAHNTWGARTPRRVASRGCLSPGFPPTPPNRSSRPPSPALTRRPDPTWAPPSPQTPPTPPLGLSAPSSLPSALASALLPPLPLALPPSSRALLLPLLPPSFAHAHPLLPPSPLPARPSLLPPSVLSVLYSGGGQ